MLGKKLLIASFLLIGIALVIGCALILIQSTRLEAEISSLRADLVNTHAIQAEK